MLLIGPPGAGKSDLLLRLLARGFELVADDRTDVMDGIGRPVPALAGLLEVRGLGIFRVPYVASARLALVVQLGQATARMPMPARHDSFHLPLAVVDAHTASAPERVGLALDCALGEVPQITGIFAV